MCIRDSPATNRVEEDAIFVKRANEDVEPTILLAYKVKIRRIQPSGILIPVLAIVCADKIACSWSLMNQFTAMLL